VKKHEIISSKQAPRMRVLTRNGLIKAAVACFLGLFCLLGAE